MRELGLTTSEELLERIKSDNDPLAVRVTEALLNNETYFFRDMAMFELLEKSALPDLARSREATRRLRIWSVGCSTGQEAYSLAMMFRDDGLRWDGWTIDILGTDVSSEVVTRARRGSYSRFEIQRGLPVRTMLRWFSESGDDWVVDAALKRNVRFASHNILQPAPGRFDLILCRNVLMYFQPATKALAFDRLATALEYGGLLMLGAGETVVGQTARFVSHPEWRGLYTQARLPSVATAA